MKFKYLIGNYIKIFKARDIVKMLHSNLHRNNFTQHGLHLNTIGKVKVAEMIAKTLSSSRSRKRLSPYLLRKETQKMYGQDSMKPSPKQRSTRILRVIL
jgi:hypothetical protein